MDPIALILVTIVGLLVMYAGIKPVPQGPVFIVERLGKFQRTLTPGLKFVIPRPRHRPREDDLSEQLLTREIVATTADRHSVTASVALRRDKAPARGGDAASIDQLGLTTVRAEIQSVNRGR